MYPKMHDKDVYVVSRHAGLDDVALNEFFQILKRNIFLSPTEKQHVWGALSFEKVVCEAHSFSGARAELWYGGRYDGAGVSVQAVDMLFYVPDTRTERLVRLVTSHEFGSPVQLPRQRGVAIPRSYQLRTAKERPIVPL